MCLRDVCVNKYKLFRVTKISHVILLYFAADPYYFSAFQLKSHGTNCQQRYKDELWYAVQRITPFRGIVFVEMDYVKC